MHEQNGWWYKHYQLSTIIPFMYTHIYVCICIYLYVIPYVSNKPHIIWNLPEPTKNPAFQELLCWRLLNAGFSVFFLCLCSKHHGFSFCWGNSSGNWRITLKIYWDNIIYIWPTYQLWCTFKFFVCPPQKIYIYIWLFFFSGCWLPTQHIVPTTARQHATPVFPVVPALYTPRRRRFGVSTLNPAMASHSRSHSRKRIGHDQAISTSSEISRWEPFTSIYSML